jgi:hypothetical protein
LERLGSISATRFCKSAILATEEDIASSFEDLQIYDLFFFFGLLWLKVKDSLSGWSPPSSSQALSLKNLPGKRLPTVTIGEMHNPVRLCMKFALVNWPIFIKCPLHLTMELLMQRSFT